MTERLAETWSALGMALRGKPVAIIAGDTLLVVTPSNDDAHRLAFFESEIVRAFKRFGVTRVRFRADGREHG